MKITQDIETPFNIKIGFNKLLKSYEAMLDSDDEFAVRKAKEILAVAEQNPVLREGFDDPKYFEELKSEIATVMQDCFSSVLTLNEIKVATIPFQNVVFNSSQRFKNIIKNAGEDFQLEVKNLPEDDSYIIGCIVILNHVFGYQVSFKRPYYYQIPDASGFMRHYKILYNADFVEIEKTASAPDITEEDYNELLDNFDNIELWKEKFPKGSYNFTGFGLANIVDVTDDQSISNIKSNLIADGTNKTVSFVTDLRQTFRSLFNLEDIDIGFSQYNPETDAFEQVYGEGFESFMLLGKEAINCKSAFCENSYKTILEEKEFFAIADVDRYFKLSQGQAPQYKILKEAGIKSAILAPIANKKGLLGVLEIVSKKPKVLNSINANKLNDIMPFIVMGVERSKREEANLIEAIIQQECTSIHPSVHWKFKDEAKSFIRAKVTADEVPTFKKISFENVYPLFGQIDVKGSSDARNSATQKDLALQLKMASSIISSALDKDYLPVFEQVKFQLDDYNSEIISDFKVDSEHTISSFLRNEVQPILELIATKHQDLESEVSDYISKIDDDLGVIYFYRKHYDDSVKLINKNMSSLLDAKQIEAQKMYPHFFERFKTDGVEHNMYIGEAITKEENFNEIYLFNLRLWQLQVMCEMENEYYHKQHEYPVALDVASMVLVFNQPLTIGFRMDEKRFDVDGTYNARYEVVKKRVDKAYIKGTEERVTQKGKLTIVYSQKEDEIEYKRYIKFLQSKQLLNDDMEVVELEDLQGVTGLRALRTSILYHSKEDSSDAYYTYEDLMDTIKS
ncbi:GAF domain-containing protein [Winogradskyella maritima]|uniref:GAF domain-containing protein n=1 Tax=Winogradskyella maritima TaxID=1517766 RepID=A0ABV8AFT0_9FLAO|nr:GAF domain-containing protein [Winogradskyella maritima]